MESKDLKTIVEEIKKQDNMYFLDATTEEKIKEFEKTNDVKLPMQYKEWLCINDGGEFYLPAGIQLYGVEHKPVIDVDEDDRPNDNYIVIGTLPTGDPILCEKDGEGICIYNHEAGRIEDDEKYDCFVNFLEDIRDLLGIEED